MIDRASRGDRPAWRCAGGGSTQAQIVTALSPSPATLYDQGTIAGVTGANAGAEPHDRAARRRRRVVCCKPWLYPVAVGDTFQLLPGCDHTAATCNGTFDNLARFGGFPYIPPPELAV